MINQNLDELKNQLEAAKDVLILIAEKANYDSTASALALYLSLQDKEDRNVTIASPSQIRVEFSRLVGVDKISQKIGSRNLIITFDYVTDSIEKVSYNVESDKFNLVIQPKSNMPPLKAENVNYSYSGAQADLIFIVGANSLDDLGSIYQAEKAIFDKAVTVSVNKNLRAPFARLTFSDPQVSSVSELTTELLTKLNLPVTQDTATNLLSGIDSATQRFASPVIKAHTFETAALLMNKGAKRQMERPENIANFPPPASFGPFNRPNPLTPTQPVSQNSAPDDWLAPKIFKGSTQV